MPRDRLRGPPEPAFTICHQDPEYFPGIAVIHHDSHGAARADIIPDLLEDTIGMRRVVDDSKRINQVIGFGGQYAGKRLTASVQKLDAVSQTIDLGAFAGHLERLLGKVHCGYPGSVASKIDRVRADAAANFQHTL